VERNRGMTVPREPPGGEPDSEFADRIRSRPVRDASRFDGQNKRDGRSQVGVSGALRARDVSRPAVTPRHES